MSSTSTRATTDISRPGIVVAAALAVVGAMALTLQLVASIAISVDGGHTVARAVWRFVGYFTILTNVLVAWTMTRVARGRWPGGPTPDASTITGVVLAIFVVGVVYEGVLSGRVPAMGPLWWVADRLLHYVVPAAAVLWWLAFVPKGTLTSADPPRWLRYPLGYLVYALARGAVDGWYPYFFIDVGSLGYARALTNAAALSVAMLVAGYGVVGLVALARRVASV